MKKQILIGGVILSVLAALSFAAQDKYSLAVPDGLAFAEFRGYEGWEAVAVSQTESQNVLRVMLANPVMMKAYREGVPGSGKPFPDGSKMAKILWTPKTITTAPFSPSKPDVVSGALTAVEFIEKDSKRFPDTHGWGYGEFVHDAASDTFKPLGTGASCGAACHNLAAKKDYIFTDYSPR